MFIAVFPVNALSVPKYRDVKQSNYNKVSTVTLKLLIEIN